MAARLTFLMMALGCWAWAAGPAVPRVDAWGDSLPEHAVTRLGTTRFRGEGQLNAVALSHDGKLLAVAEEDGHWLYDARTGKRKRRLSDDDRLRSGDSLTFSPNDQWIIRVQRDELTIFGVVKPLVVRLGTDRDARGLRASFSRDGKRIAIGSEGRDRKARVILQTFPDGKQLARIEHSISRASVDLLPDGRTLLVWGAEGIEVYDTEKERRIRALDRSEQMVAVACSADGKSVAGLRYGKLIVWNAMTGKRLVEEPFSDKVNPCHIRFRPDGKRIAVGSDSGVIEVRDTTNGKLLHEAKAPAGPRDLRFRPDGTLIAVYCWASSILLWDVRLGNWLTPTGGHLSSVQSLAFSRDGKWLITSAADGGIAWDTRTWREARRVLRDARPTDHTLISPGGTYLLSVSRGRLPALYDVATGNFLTNVPEELEAEGRRVSFSADEKYVALVTPARLISGGNQRAKVRELPGQRLVFLADFHSSDGASKATLSRDGSLLAFSGRLTYREGPHPVTILATASDEKKGARFDLTRAASRLTFSSDGRWLAAGGVSPRVLDTATGANLWSFDPGPNVGISTPHFSPDGRLLAAGRIEAGARNTEALIWELASGQLRMRLTAPEGEMVRPPVLAFSHDGRLLAVGGALTTTLVYDLTGRDKGPGSHARPGPSDWTDLASADAVRAFGAMRRLMGHPREAVTLLRARLPAAPGKPLADSAIARLIADLGNDDFDVRQKASTDLHAVGWRIVSQLEKAWDTSKDLESKQRLHAIIKKAHSWPGPGMLRPVRALEVLERLDTPEARRLMTELAGGNPDARLTGEAKKVLARMGR